MFNTFKYTKQLEEAGFSRQQAEIQLQVMTEIIEGDLATKQDLHTFGAIQKQDLETFSTIHRKDLDNVESSIRKDLEAVESSIRKDMFSMEFRLENKIQQLESKIIIKLGGIFILGFTCMATLLKFWLD